MFVKHYAPNHMPDPKGKWSLKENNSELHYGNIQKLISSSTPWSVTICQISGSYPNSSLDILFTRLFLYKMRVGSKVNQFIYTLVCYYMPNIRILAKLVLQIFCSQGCSNTKCLSLKKGSTSTKHLRNRFKS